MSTDPASARSSRRSAGVQSILNLVLLVIIVAALNYLGDKYYAHRDLSISQFYTLSDKTKDELKRLDSPLSITMLTLDSKAQQGWDQAYTLLQEYKRAGGKNVSLEKVDASMEYARAVDLQKRLHFEGSENLIIFEYKGNSRFVKQTDLSDVNPMTGQSAGFKGEQQFTTSIAGLVEGKQAKVYFTEGHGEHGIQDSQNGTGYGLLYDSIKSDNVESETLNLGQKGLVPHDADAVVIAGPTVPFAPIEVQALQRYLGDNGKLFILLDPYTTLGFEDLLKQYGLTFDNDLVLNRTLTNQGQMTLPLAQIYQSGFSSHPITQKFAQANVQLLMMDTRSVTLEKDAKGQPNPKTQALLQTDADAWGWIGKTPAPTAADPNADLLSIKDRTFDQTTDLRGPLTIAAVYDGGMFTDAGTKAEMSGTRIIVVGSSKFAENDVNQQTGANFFVNCVDWLTKKDAVLDISPKKPLEYGLALSPMQFRTVTWTAFFFVPGAALVLGVLAWFSRRK